MVNNNLVTAQESVGTNLLDPAYSGEIISYVIIEKGSSSLTTNTSLPYSLQYDVHLNAVFVPTAFDSFANNLARNSTRNGSWSNNPLPSLTTGIQYNPEAPVKRTSNWKDVLKQVTGSKAGQLIMSQLGNFAMSALLASPGEAGVTESVVDVATTR